MVSETAKHGTTLRWPAKKTAFLIIHGIGEQDPFETLDNFTRPFWKLLSSFFHPEKIEGRHKLSNWKDWVESYVSLVKDGDDKTSIDFYEYYWAYKMERQITFSEIYDWLIRTSEGAGKYYAENPPILTGERKGIKIFTEKGAFETRGYLKMIGWYLRILFYLSKFLPERGYISKILNTLLGEAEKVIVDYIGDIAIYTSTDIKSRHYEIQQAVLSGAVQKITRLLEMDYGQVVIAGHSLGSVIAYDALNRLNRDMNVNNIDPKFAVRLAGLVTFGSPLDKIAFFFREHVEKDKYVLKQVLDHFHSFKVRQPNISYNPILSNPLARLLDHMPWINYWNKEDPVSGHLDCYDIPDKNNIHLPLDAPWGIAHVKYWDFVPMYQDIAERLLR